MSDAPLLQVENLRTQFSTEHGTITAVDGVSFEIPRGRTLGVVGESGCGKSVTALSVMRLIPDPPGKIASGRILYDGVDVLGLAEPDMRALRGNKISMKINVAAYESSGLVISSQLLELADLVNDNRRAKR